MGSAVGGRPLYPSSRGSRHPPVPGPRATPLGWFANHAYALRSTSCILAAGEADRERGCPRAEQPLHTRGTVSKVWGFLGEHGFLIMMAGFAVAVRSLLFFMQYRFTPGPAKSTSGVFFVIGIAVYVIGRLGVSFQRRAQKRSSSRPDQ